MKSLKRAALEKLIFVAKLRSPIIVRGYLTFDALLAALHFDRHGDPARAHAEIPIRATDGLFHASAAIFTPIAKRTISMTASLRARHDLWPDLFRKTKDGSRLHRKLGEKRRQDYGNVLSS